MTSHAGAVLKGRLSKRHQESIELAQKRYEEKLLELQQAEEGGKGRGGGGSGKGKRSTLKRMRQGKRGDANLELLENTKEKRSLWNAVKSMQYSLFR